MSQVQITLPDGSAKQVQAGQTGFDLAKSISPRLAKDAIAVKVDGEVRDLHRPLDRDAQVQILTFNDSEGREVFWHSSAHVMAQAVTDVFPKAKLAIGPPIEEGWYYDFEVEKPFAPEDLEKIEKRMSEIIKEDAPFSCEYMDREKAIEYYRSQGADYKVEMLEEFDDDRVSVYHHSTFEDLCRGPHIPSTGKIRAFKLIATSAAYWRGDENRQTLQRIYGVSYPKKSMLEDYLTRLEEAKKRDHRVLGKQLELFHISPEVGAGLVMWLPKGARVRNEIENFWREEHLRYGYELVYSPHIANLELWRRSGHTDFYSEDMFEPIKADNQMYQLKPMNCPFHITMYQSRRWSYRDLPMRWAELGTVYRFEKAGVVHGLARVRGFTQDDAHHFCTKDQMEDELVWLLDFCTHMLSSFGLDDYEIFLSTRPEKAIGDPADWVLAENGLKLALEKSGLRYSVDEGGGAFYGPKIDIKIRDAIGRSWQCSTIQFDFSLPERFDLQYIGPDGQPQRPYMIHRALLGSIERFFGVLIEHHAGKFPLWLAPVQARVLTITDDFNDYGREVTDRLKSRRIRAEFDDRSEKIGAKIRDAELQKVPYMLIIGAREKDSNSLSIRRHGEGDLGSKPVDEVVDMLLAEIESKGLEPSESEATGGLHS
jgi:threonyl-tRNA synthetase